MSGVGGAQSISGESHDRMFSAGADRVWRAAVEDKAVNGL